MHDRIDQIPGGALRWGRRIWPKLAVWVGPDPNPPPGKFPGIFFPEKQKSGTFFPENPGNVRFFKDTFRHQKTTVEKSLERIKGAKLSKKFAGFGIFKKFWEGAALRRIFIFQFFSLFIFLLTNGPPIFSMVKIGPIAHKISKIHQSESPQNWEIGHFVQNGIFQFFWFSQKPSQNFQKILIPSNSLDNFLHFTFSDHLSISKIKIPKLPLKSGTPLWPPRFGHFCRFFCGFSHILRNPLEVAKNWKFH